APVLLRLQEVAPKAVATVLNRINISETAARLNCRIKIEPRRGRIGSIDLLLVGPGAGELAQSRIQSGPHVAEVKLEATGKYAAHLRLRQTHPTIETLETTFDLELPVDTSGSTVPLLLAMPVQSPDSQAFVLVHRELEGELTAQLSAELQPLEV